MVITELEYFDQNQFVDLKELLAELSDRVVFTQEDLVRVLEDNGCHLYVVQDNGRVIGCATLCIFHSLTGTKGSIEDVVVSSPYRGRHIGRMLMEHVIEQTKQFAPLDLFLTSKPKRVAANNLYHSLGFQKKDTNCYRMEIR